MAESKDSSRPAPKPDEKIIKEGGYQPTSDPGEVPESLVKPTEDNPAESPSQSKDGEE